MSAIRKVLVTGGSGYIAKHIIRELLLAGENVRATVRTPARGEEIAAAVLPTVPDPQAHAQLEHAIADLEQDAGWAQAMEGIEVLVHTASPFPLAQPSERLALVGPAVAGTLRVLRAAKAAGVKRVVLTSSVVAASFPAEGTGTRMVDETDWSDPDHRLITPYAISKTLAERAAWDFVRDEAPEIALTTLLPGMVFGPALDMRFGTSLETVQRLLRAKDPMQPDIGFTVVDVRDIAAAHARVIDNAATHGERLLLTERYLGFPDMARLLAGWYPGRGISTRVAPRILIRLLALFDGGARAIVHHQGVRFDASSAKAKQMIGLPARSGEQALHDSADFLLEHGLL